MITKKVKKVTYNIWAVVEQITEYEDGSEKIKDLKGMDYTSKIAKPENLDEAIKLINKLEFQEM